MFNFAKKAALASALAATALTSASPAMAQGYPYGSYGGGYRHHDGGDTTGAAIVGGIVGIAIGALIASSGNRNRHRGNDYAYRNGWEWRDGYYWDRAGHRYDREGRNCDNDRDGRYSSRNQDYGDGYYQRRGYRDGDGYRDGEGYRGGDGYRGGYRGY
ncbi:MAG: hypothetical protein ABIM50_06225 [Novosphingobium sp.]